MEAQRGLYSGINTHLYAGVPQHAYAITTAESSRSILFTCHVSSCIAVTLYDKKRKVAALFHIDVDIQNTVREVFQKLKMLGIQLNELDVHMIGGVRTCDDEFKKYCAGLKKEILLYTPHLTEKLFENEEDDNLDPSTLSGDALNAAKEKWQQSRYKQIALDALTGEVLISRDSNPLDETMAFSQAALDWQNRCDLIYSLGKVAVFYEITAKPLVNVYDGTNITG